MMNKVLRNIAVVFSLVCSLAVSAQDLMVKKDGNSLFLEHKVAAKEGLYSIGRIYNIHPADLAAYNSMDINKGLNLGQVLKVPLTENNFTQSAVGGTPVYYRVGEKEGLYRVGVNTNASVEDIKKLNRLTSDQISVGTKLIVGYVLSGDPTQVVAKAEEKPVIPNVPVKEEKKPEPKAEMVKQEPVRPVIVEKKEEKKPEPKAEVYKAEPVKSVVSTVSGNGYFKSEYESQLRTQQESKELTVTSGIFKTVSGWQDEKYYLLMDDVDPGTIVKISNPTNGKHIYAKVLGKMSGIRQNQGLNIRISNAAASVLEVSDTDKFIVKVVY